MDQEGQMVDVTVNESRVIRLFLRRPFGSHLREDEILLAVKRFENGQGDSRKIWISEVRLEVEGG